MIMRPVAPSPQPGYGAFYEYYDQTWPDLTRPFFCEMW